MSSGPSADDRLLPYGRQLIEEDDVAAVAAVLRGEWLTTGPAVHAFEAALAAATGTRFAVSCSSGTAALHLAVLALGLGPGRRVIVPAMTFAATANAVCYVGGEVVFADVDPRTGLMTPATFVAALARAGSDVDLALPVHLNGAMCDMAALAPLAREHGITLVEDACHALGSTAHAADGTRYGPGDARFSTMAVYSGHPVKTIAMGEGGAVTTNDAAVAERLSLYRGHGMVREPAAFVDREHGFSRESEPEPWYHEMQVLGFNYRASDLHCALGLSQLGKLARFAAERIALHRRYVERLAPLAPHVEVVRAEDGVSPVWHLCALRLDFAALGFTRGRLMHELRARGIGSQVHYIPVYRHPFYVVRYGRLALPGAEAYYARELSVPLFAGMTIGDVDRVCSTLADILGWRL